MPSAAASLMRGDEGVDDAEQLLLGLAGMASICLMRRSSRVLRLADLRVARTLNNSRRVQ